MRDHAVKSGDREDTEDGGATEDQHRPATLGLRSLVRTQQCVKPGRIAKLRPGHIDYEIGPDDLSLTRIVLEQSPAAPR